MGGVARTTPPGTAPTTRRSSGASTRPASTSRGTRPRSATYSPRDAGSASAWTRGDIGRKVIFIRTASFLTDERAAEELKRVYEDYKLFLTEEENRCIARYEEKVELWESAGKTKE